MLLAFIGTSGSGKSYWAQRLASELGYSNYCCDSLIEEKLKDVLVPYGSGLSALAAWMGEPYDERYPKTQAEYSRREAEVLNEIIELLDENQSNPESNIVIDTAGSFVYTGEEICREYQKRARVVYLEVSEESRDSVFDIYFDDPKPIVWGESFKMREGEQPKQALARCYHDLMEYRSALYEKYADVTLPFHVHRDSSLTAADFIELVS